MFTQELGAIDPGMREIVATYFEEWTGLVRGLIDEAVLVLPEAERPDTSALARTVVASIEGALILAKAWQDREPMRQTVAEVGAHVARALKLEAIS